MYGSELADDSDELAALLNTFWSEHHTFISRTGDCFKRPWIWNKQSNKDLDEGLSHIWHRKNSYGETKVFGKFACRVCSKIVGMGSAERNWGDVKHLKSAKRSHLGQEAVEKQATIFGASCMEYADMKREYAKNNSKEAYKFWDDDDFDEEFNMLVETTSKSIQSQRFIKCYIEEWESESIKKKNDLSKKKLLVKYGGLEFEDLDHRNRSLYRIDKDDMVFKTRVGWCVTAYLVGGTRDDFDVWAIDSGLHDCLATYYTKHPNKNVVPLIRKDQVETIADLATWEAPLDTEEVMIPKQSTSQKNQKNNATRNVPVPDYHAPTADGQKGMKQRNTVSISSKDSTTVPGEERCGNCGKVVQPVAHRCDMCNCAMHAICGPTIGEEGYGAKVRCPKCNV